MSCRYQSYLRRARTENFTELASLGAFYKAGRDYMGRQIVVYVGRLFPAPKVDLSKVQAPPPVCYVITFTPSSPHVLIPHLLIIYTPHTLKRSSHTSLQCTLIPHLSPVYPYPTPHSSVP